MIFLDTKDSKGIRLEIEFFEKRSIYEVRVSYEDIKYKKEVPCTFTPTFGMDILDQNQCLIEAEKLAEKIDKEKNL